MGRWTTHTLATLGIVGLFATQVEAQQSSSVIDGPNATVELPVGVGVSAMSVQNKRAENSTMIINYQAGTGETFELYNRKISNNDGVIHITLSGAPNLQPSAKTISVTANGTAWWGSVPQPMNRVIKRLFPTYAELDFIHDRNDTNDAPNTVLLVYYTAPLN